MEQRGKNNKSFDTMNKNNQNFDEVKQRLLEFVENKKLKKMVFYDTIGMKQSNFSGEGAASSLKTENIIKVLIAFPDINPDWLLLGKGEMLRNATTANNYANDDKVSRLITILQDTLAEKDKQINRLLSIIENKGLK